MSNQLNSARLTLLVRIGRRSGAPVASSTHRSDERFSAIALSIGGALVRRIRHLVTMTGAGRAWPELSSFHFLRQRHPGREAGPQSQRSQWFGDGSATEKAFADARSATLIVVGAPMKRSIPLLFALAFVASCDDEPAKTAVVPTAPAIAPMAAQASASTADISGGSTICRVYATERDVAKTELDAAPTDTVQQRRVKTLDALVKETCN